ncbi:sensor histidine kinase [Pseudazoarcus pumilus]|uniref:histidine kinase n=1 Tax=Pseudazoarcus pumilus TaxID=2067960 RepID=A0A2I6S5W8_9RHOO|nr:sensor histidine kinase [Pseudazoarcus pumilus]AUN94662.1 ATP-binding protein [Pseudazoarcus pumilus]
MNPTTHAPRRWRNSLGLRLVAGTLCWVAVALVVAGWGLSALFAEHVTRQFRAELGTHLDELAAAIEFDADGALQLRAPLGDPRMARPYSGLYWQVDRVALEANKGVLRSRSLWDGVLAMPAEAATDGQRRLHHVRGPDGADVLLLEQILRLDDLTLRVGVAGNEALVSEPVARFNGLLALALLILGLGLVSASVMQLRIALRPLRRVRDELGQVRDGSVSRLAGSYPDELQPLVNEFNDVLAQNSAVVARARTQAGNLAHALKTPLTILANAAREGDGALARSVAEQTQVAQRHIERHLAHARAAARAGAAGQRVPLQPVLEGLLRVMRRLHAERDLTLELEDCPAAAVFRGDEQDLQEMLGNLLDNACKWAARRVIVSAGIVDQALIVTVEDDGRGIPEHEQEAMLQRGVRADERTPGSGLGLSIALELAELYGGGLTLDTSPLGGLQASLRLPAIS